VTVMLDCQQTMRNPGGRRTGCLNNNFEAIGSNESRSIITNVSCTLL
jgi:hypothetical protein